MDRKFWAKAGKDQSGPHATKEAALSAFRAAFPQIGERNPGRLILVGYGEGGPWFSMEWERFKPR